MSSSLLPSSPPPDTLPLDEALATAKLGARTGEGHDVAATSKKVGKYMSKLQSYLEVNFSFVYMEAHFSSSMHILHIISILFPYIEKCICM